MGSCSSLHITLFTTFIFFQAFSLQPTLSLDIPKVLTDNNFSVFASLLSAPGVIEDFNKAQGDAGITIFVPSNAAFDKLPESQKIETLPAEKRGLVIKFHGIHSYYAQDVMKVLVNPFQPTLATEATSALSFRFNLSQSQGNAAIQTGIGNGALVLNTVYDLKPVAIYSVSDVFLPTEIFQ